MTTGEGKQSLKRLQNSMSELHVSWEQSGPRKQPTPQGTDKFL